MPRTYGKSKGKAKQTRLSFVSTTLPSEEQDNDAGRQANVRFEHPSMPTLRNARQSRGETTSKVPFVRVNPSPKEDSASESDTPIQKPSHRKKNGSSRNSCQNQNNTPPPPMPQDSESDIEPVQSARKSIRDKHLKRKRSSPTPEATGSLASNGSDADDIVTRPRRKLRRGGAGGAAQTATVLDDSSEESNKESVISLSSEMSKSETPHTPRRDTNQDELDLEEDLEALQDSVVKESRTRGRLANSARVQRQRHLETLRRRRAGKRETDDEEQSTVENDGPDSDENGNEAEEEPTIQPAKFRGWTGDSDVESSIASDDDLDRYEEDFVLEDDNDKLGVPNGTEDMPIEFSRHAYKQLKDYFQDAVEWMVHNQLNPAFPRSDSVYKLAFDKLEAEVRGRTGSQLVSSVWNSNFRRALLARPQMEISAFPTTENHPCDACNRSGHPASSDIRLHGKAYSLETLEPLSDADSDEDESESETSRGDSQERDRDGHVLPADDTRFYLGRHCMNKARMAHILTHWRFHLNEWVLEHLRIKGYMSDEKIVKRSQWSQKRKNKHATKAVESMIADGEIKKLWRDFHINLRTARETTSF